MRLWMQDALVDATDKKSFKRVKDGLEFYNYEVYSPVSLFFSACVTDRQNQSMTNRHLDIQKIYQ